MDKLIAWLTANRGKIVSAAGVISAVLVALNQSELHWPGEAGLAIWGLICAKVGMMIGSQGKAASPTGVSLPGFFLLGVGCLAWAGPVYGQPGTPAVRESVTRADGSSACCCEPCTCGPGCQCGDHKLVPVTRTQAKPMPVTPASIFPWRDGIERRLGDAEKNIAGMQAATNRLADQQAQMAVAQAQTVNQNAQMLALLQQLVQQQQAGAIALQRLQQPVAPPAPQYIVLGQGSNPQPLSLQGSNPQPLSLQGANPQPLSVQGANPQPLSPQGANPQPLSPGGANPQKLDLGGPAPGTVPANPGTVPANPPAGTNPQILSPGGANPQKMPPATNTGPAVGMQRYTRATWPAK